MSRHTHGWRHWQRACPRCRQRRRSVLSAIASALVMGSLLALTFTGGNSSLPATRLVTAAQPAQTARSAGNPGSLYQLAAATTQLTASQTTGLTAHQRHLLHLAHLAYLAWLARLDRPVTVAAVSSSLDGRLLAEAETQQGTPYVYGGDAPGGFDCSGLVYWAAQRLGITAMPRDTFTMLAAVGSVLIPVTWPSSDRAMSSCTSAREGSSVPSRRVHSSATTTTEAITCPRRTMR